MTPMDQELDEFEQMMTGSLRGAVDDTAAVHEGTTLGTDDPQPQKRKDPPTSAEGKGAKQQKKVPENRAVYVTNIPRDATYEELCEEFTYFGGVIDLGTDGKMRVKMYKNEAGEFNGEALIVYFKPASVNQAILRADGMSLRPGDLKNGEMHVEAAGNEYKKNVGKEQVQKAMARKDRKTAERIRADLSRKVSEWSDDDEELRETFAPKKNKWAKNVIVENFFRPIEIQESVEEYNITADDIALVAEKFGEVTKIVIYDDEPRGIIVVRYKEFEDAENFQKAYNGVVYDRRKLVTWLAEDRPKFRKTKKDGDSDDEDGKLQQHLKDLDDGDD